MQDSKEEIEGLQEPGGLGEKETSLMYGCCRSKPDNLERSAEDVLSPRLPADNRSRQSFRRGSWPPLSLSLGPLQTSPQLTREGPSSDCPSPPSLGPRRKGRLCLC